MNAALAITFLTYLVTGALPPIVAHYLMRVDFLGGAWAASAVGVIAAVLGGLAQTVLLPGLPDLIVIAGAVDAIPPLVASVLVTLIFALVSGTNQS